MAAVAMGIPGVGAPIDEGDRRQLRATYYGMMAEVDDQLGRLLGWLGDEGLLDDTLVVLTSDHGDQMGDHWLIEKLGWWDESYHVPLIVCDPRAEADARRGSVVATLTEHVDVLPTIVHVDGRRGAAAVRRAGPPAVPPRRSGPAGPDGWRTEVHWEWDFRNPWLHLAEDLLGIPMEQCSLNVVRGPRWKYVHFAADPSVLPPLLFDLEADPEGCVDLAADPGHAGDLADVHGIAAALAHAPRRAHPHRPHGHTHRPGRPARPPPLISSHDRERGSAGVVGYRSARHVQGDR